MKRQHTGSAIRAALAAAVAILALSIVGASVASAATPEFKPVPTKKKFTESKLGTKFVYGTNSIECAGGTASGEVTGAHTIGKVIEKLTGCKTTGASKEGCNIESNGAALGEIVTQDLDGELGTVSTTEAASGVGLLLKAEAEKGRWTTLVANECTVETAVTGQLAAEVPVIGKKQTTNELVFGFKGSEQAIQEITLDSGKKVETELAMWSVSARMESAGELKFEEALEVT
jgi:hypothetical protein